jgi:hypothetical protein
MTRFPLASILDPAAYAQLANLHRPTDPAALAAEIRRLHANGLTSYDIAAALRVAHDQIASTLAADADVGATR